MTNHSSTLELSNVWVVIWSLNCEAGCLYVDCLYVDGFVFFLFLRIWVSRYILVVVLLYLTTCESTVEQFIVWVFMSTHSHGVACQFVYWFGFLIFIYLSVVLLSPWSCSCILREVYCIPIYIRATDII